MKVLLTKTKSNSILLGLFIAQNNLSFIIKNFIDIPNLSFFIICFLVFTYVLVNKTLKVTFGSIIYILVISLLMLLSLIFVGNFAVIFKHLQYFMMFGIPALLFFSNDFDMKITLKTMIYLVTVVLTLYLMGIIGTDFRFSETYWSDQFSISYNAALLFISLFLCRKLGTKKYEYLLYLYSFIITIYILFVVAASRGPSLVIICFVIFHMIHKGYSNKTYLMKLCFLVIVLIFAFVYADSIIVYLSDFLEKIDIKIAFIDKSIFLLEQQGDISNGRDSLFQLAFYLFNESPFVGYGIGYYEMFSATNTYVHNIIFQVMVEFGLFGLVMCAIMMKKILDFIFKEDHTGFGLLLLSMTVKLMVTGIFWEEPFFYFLIAWFIVRKSRNTIMK